MSIKPLSPSDRRVHVLDAQAAARLQDMLRHNRQSYSTPNANVIRYVGHFRKKQSADRSPNRLAFELKAPVHRGSSEPAEGKLLGWNIDDEDLEGISDDLDPDDPFVLRASYSADYYPKGMKVYAEDQPATGWQIITPGLRYFREALSGGDLTSGSERTISVNLFGQSQDVTIAAVYGDSLNGAMCGYTWNALTQKWDITNEACS